MSYETSHFHSSINVREDDELSNSKLVSSDGDLPIVRRSKKFHLIGGGISSSTATSSFKYHPRITIRGRIKSFEESAHKLYEGTKGAYQSQRLINYHLSNSGLPTKPKDYSPNQICIPENVKSFAELVENFRKSLHNFQIPKLHEKSERVLSDISFDKEGKVGENLVNNVSSYASYSSDDSISDTESIAPTLEDLEQQIDDWWNSDETQNKLREVTILPDYDEEVLNLWDEVPVAESKKTIESNSNIKPSPKKRRSSFRPSESGDTFDESVSSVENVSIGGRKEKQRGRIMRCLVAIANFFWRRGK